MPSYPKNTRKCAVCREHGDKSMLFRLVKTENGIVFDKDVKLNGRGVYIHRTTECVERAEKKRVLNQAFHTAVPDTVYAELKEYINNEL